MTHIVGYKKKRAEDDWEILNWFTQSQPSVSLLNDVKLELQKDGYPFYLIRLREENNDSM